ncbi:type III secretion system outer membrane ring subunit SctC [Escherichia albertii]
MFSMSRFIFGKCISMLLFVALSSGNASVWAANGHITENNATTEANELLHPGIDNKIDPTTGNNFTVNDKSVDYIFKAISAQVLKPFIVSSKAKKYTVTGKFNLDQPIEMLNRITHDLGLIWYFDGSIYYIYEASEAKTAVVHFPARSFNDLQSFLRSNGMYDERYPLKMNYSSSTLYLSGPPKYIDIIIGIASFMGNDYATESNELVIDSIRLRYVFVDDRNYSYRGQSITMRGLASTISELLNDNYNRGPASVAVKKATTDEGLIPADDIGTRAELQGRHSAYGSDDEIKVLPFSGRNSLLIKGTQEQVNMVKDLVARLDLPRKQVEFSLWIIDINKDDLEQLGVNWQGQISSGNVQSFFNATSILSGAESTYFLATVNALSQKDKANIVSRPIILAQDNIPAIFDNSRSFYVKLMGERDVELQTVTYGTSINVVPMISDDNKLVELNVDITDGNTVSDSSGEPATVDQLPVVGNTSISTMARVAAGQNLLIGGYTRDQLSDGVTKIPLLGDIPIIGNLFKTKTNNSSKAVRLFLIQPRILKDDFSSKSTMDGYINDGWDAIKNYQQKAASVNKDSFISPR